MMILRFMEQEISCAYATKGNDWVEAHDEYGNTIFSANGVKDFSLFTLEGGEWTEPHHTMEQRVSDLEEQLIQADETAIGLYESQQEQETINAQQDEALMEIYEMLG